MLLFLDVIRGFSALLKLNLTIWSKILCASGRLAFIYVRQPINQPVKVLFLPSLRFVSVIASEKHKKTAFPGRHQQGGSLECAQFAKNRAVRRFLH